MSAPTPESKKNTFKQIELEFQVESVMVNQIHVWPFLRHYYSFSLNKILANRPSFNIWGGLSSMLYGFSNWFGRYRYLQFSDSLERKFVNNKWFDKSLDFIGLRLGHTLLLEHPLQRHYRKSEIATKNICSKLPLHGLVWIYAFVFLRNVKIKNREILEEIGRQYDCAIDFEALIKKNLAQRAIGKWLIKTYRPKAIFMQCFYTNMGFVRAFRESGIPVVEIQHGIIASHHGAYNVYKKIDPLYYPDYVFTFGEREFETFNSENHFIDPMKVKPVGHFYIDHLNNGYEGDERLKDILKNYKNSVTFSSQDILEEVELLHFLKQAALLSQETLFVFFPRHKPKNYYDQFNLPSNIILTPWINVYESIASTDFHSTMHSTCAIEAPSLGARNILINVNGLAVKYFSYLLDDRNLTYIANTPQEFVTYLQLPSQSRSEIIQQNSYFIRPNYTTNVIKALEEVIGTVAIE
jgi:hypothetical protein